MRDGGRISAALEVLADMDGRHKPARLALKAWGDANGVSDKVTMLADGNGGFVEALGLTVDGSAFGLGTRGQRFAMIVNDGVVEQLFVEAPGAFEVSSAEYVLSKL